MEQNLTVSSPSTFCGRTLQGPGRRVVMCQKATGRRRKGKISAVNSAYISLTTELCLRCKCMRSCDCSSVFVFYGHSRICLPRTQRERLPPASERGERRGRGGGCSSIPSPDLAGLQRDSLEEFQPPEPKAAKGGQRPNCRASHSVHLWRGD